MRKEGDRLTPAEMAAIPVASFVPAEDAPPSPEELAGGPVEIKFVHYDLEPTRDGNGQYDGGAVLKNPREVK